MKRQNRKVLLNGTPQIWMGVNFWSRTGGPLMWRNYDPAVIREGEPAFDARSFELGPFGVRVLELASGG